MHAHFLCMRFLVLSLTRWHAAATQQSCSAAAPLRVCIVCPASADAEIPTLQSCSAAAPLRVCVFHPALADAYYAFNTAIMPCCCHPRCAHRLCCMGGSTQQRSPLPPAPTPLFDTSRQQRSAAGLELVLFPFGTGLHVSLYIMQKFC